jgi:hypothetical protein
MCEEQKQLSAEISQALRAVIEIHCSQMAAVVLGDRKVKQFEEELGLAIRAWKRTRKAYMDHILDHQCSEYTDYSVPNK